MSTCCHGHEITGKKFKIAIAATAIILVAEVAGGLWTNSLALLSDAAHVFMDLFSLALSWTALKISELPATDKKTFGYHRFEIFAAFINGFSILLISVFIFYEAWERLSHPEPVESTGMMAIAVIGLFVNVGVAYYLWDSSNKDLNVQSAIYHVIGDALASVGVIIGGVIIYYTQNYVFDSLISFLIGAIIVQGAYRIIRKSSHILLEGVPEEINIDEVVESITKIEGVRDLHGIHVWSICSNLYSMSAHLLVHDQSINTANEIISKVNRLLADQYSITNTTFQIECEECENPSLFKKLAH